ncbi:hypothetical protein EJ06DRAFT_573847 [Trichodelitschia bisporula]|uniref:Uncharacterized protein n=1 Tax=Trichodelitschia bisporula TaxID=703511 RepID=A0A6G1I2C1_9PEZI|nr:hypothetical protein EJ06DRAFT_573847 [Trichodelitschia bisporula]
MSLPPPMASLGVLRGTVRPYVEEGQTCRMSHICPTDIGDEEAKGGGCMKPNVIRGTAVHGEDESSDEDEDHDDTQPIRKCGRPSYGYSSGYICPDGGTNQGSRYSSGKHRLDGDSGSDTDDDAEANRRNRDRSVAIPARKAATQPTSSDLPVRKTRAPSQLLDSLPTAPMTRPRPTYRGLLYGDFHAHDSRWARCLQPVQRLQHAA